MHVTGRIVYALLLSLVSASFAQAADTWNHRTLRSSEGVEIRLDYRLDAGDQGPCAYRCEVTFRANEAWLNVSLPSSMAGADDRVSVVFVNEARNVYSDYRTDFYEPAISLDLAPANENRQTVQLPSFRVSRSFPGSADRFTQHLSISVNGAWLVDPISGRTDFEVTASE